MKNLTAPSQTTTEQEDRMAFLEKQNEELKQLVAWYEEQYRLFKAKNFGASSEKVHEDQLELSLFNEAEITAGEESPVVPTDGQEKEKTQTRKVRETNLQHLPVETVTYSLPEEEQACLSCGQHTHVMKKEIRKEIKVIPAQVKIIYHEREVYACRHCEAKDISTPIVTAPMPNPVIPKSMASPSAVAHVITQKYMMGIPLYRQEQQFAQDGIRLSRQTLSNWIIHSTEKWIYPLIQLMKQTLSKQDILHADETTLQVLHEEGRTAQNKSYMWVYRTGKESPPCILFDYQTTRAAKHPKKFLEDFKGTLHVDGYQGYMDLKNVTLSGCWTHARRKFVEAQKSAPKQSKGSPTIAEQAIQKIGDLYQIEKEIVSLDTEKRQKVRREKSLPLVEAYFAWLKSIKPHVLPKSKLGEAIQYSLNQRSKLEVPFRDGRLEIDNNRAERTIKPFVIGRKNWLFANTSKGARASAAIYSLIETAKENGLHIFPYFMHLYETLPNINIEDSEALKQLVPWSTQLPEQCYAPKHDDK